jgi:hypothetical protein
LGRGFFGRLGRYDETLVEPTDLSFGSAIQFAKEVGDGCARVGGGLVSRCPCCLGALVATCPCRRGARVFEGACYDAQLGWMRMLLIVCYSASETISGEAAASLLLSLVTSCAPTKDGVGTARGRNAANRNPARDAVSGASAARDVCCLFRILLTIKSVW